MPRGLRSRPDAVNDAESTPTPADAATKSRPQSPGQRPSPRLAPPSRKALPQQIPIDGRLLIQPPRVPSWGAFGRRPSVPADRLRMGRHPKPFTLAVIRNEQGLRLSWVATIAGGAFPLRRKLVAVEGLKRLA